MTVGSAGPHCHGPARGRSDRGAGTSSSSGGTAVVLSCDSETSFSTMHMHVTLGTSSSSYITCVTNWSGETGLSWRQWLDSSNGAMARV
jgi:hypothetical protein